jgi:hypothetical protein
VKLLAMPPSSVLFFFGFELVITTSLYLLHVPLLFRKSSYAKGERTPPGVFTIMEDVVAVDGNGGMPYRESLRARFEASPNFRKLIVEMGFFWGIGAIVIAAATTAVIFSIRREIAYGIGWSVPFVWAAIWTIITFWWVKKSLRKERVEWDLRGESQSIFASIYYFDS